VPLSELLVLLGLVAIQKLIKFFRWHPLDALLQLPVVAPIIRIMPSMGFAAIGVQKAPQLSPNPLSTPCHRAIVPLGTAID
jgi:hypothetical protein